MGPRVFGLALVKHSRYGLTTRRPVRLRVGLGGCYDHSPRRHVIKAEASMSAIACYRHVCVPYSLQVPSGK